jgi:nucleoid-associated protein YgaU
MKLNKLFSVLTLTVVLTVTSFAQVIETEEQWMAEMNKYKAQKEQFQKEVTTLQNDVNVLKSTLGNIQSYDDCMKDYYQMIGATGKVDIDNFRKAVLELEGKIKRKEGPKSDRQSDLNVLKMNKISALPEFFNKVHYQLQSLLDEWVDAPKDVTYTVVKGDCLWNIAKKKEHYGNGFAWPKIYNANRDQIKNPDLIYPKQIFKIPPLTEEEKAKYEKLRANYKPAPIK